MKTQIHSRGISPKTGAIVSLLLSVVGIAVAVYLMPASPTTVQYVEMAEVLAAGAFAGSFLSLGFVLLSIGIFGGFLLMPIIWASTYPSVGIVHIVFLWARWPEFSIIVLSWLMIAVGAGRMVWMTMQLPPSTDNADGDQENGAQ